MILPLLGLRPAVSVLASEPGRPLQPPAAGQISRRIAMTDDKKPMTLSREDLYELVWSKPMMELAKDFGISDVALAKRCRRLGIPVPGRGYWARVDAGQIPYRPKLPKREAKWQVGRASRPVPLPTGPCAAQTMEAVQDSAYARNQS